MIYCFTSLSNNHYQLGEGLQHDVIAVEEKQVEEEEIAKGPTSEGDPAASAGVSTSLLYIPMC